MIDSFLIPLLKIAIVLNATLVGVTYMVLLERKVIAWAPVSYTHLTLPTNREV